MKRFISYAMLIFLLAGCSMETYNTPRDLNNRIGVIEIHRCFCGPSAYRYLIVIQDNKDTLKYNPVNLPENYTDNNYRVIFSADLLNDSSIVYTNTPTDAVVEDFRVRNIKLSTIRKCSDLSLNDTIDLVYGKTYRNYENGISIRLDSVSEDSRCPFNVECVWAGNAKVSFDFASNNRLSQFSLNTSSGFRNDTLISGYEIKLIDLKPYPVYPTTILQRDYIARIKITQ
ncbi:MAG: hypothetical protein PHT07_14340 [Paludibacter sp.]|nr:hypothetical protein [Paludibacter sp.]